MEAADQGGQDMRVLGIEVIERPVEVGWHAADEITLVLMAVALAELDACDLGDAVGGVGFFHRAGEQAVLANRDFSGLGVDAGAAEEEELRHTKVGCCLDDIVLNREVFDEELDRLLKIGGNASHSRGRIHDIVRTLGFKKNSHGGAIHQVQFLPRAGEDVLKSGPLEAPHDGAPDHSAMPGHKNLRFFFHAVFLADLALPARRDQPARRPASSDGYRNA